MRAARDHLLELAEGPPIRCIYSDLDGTLVGPGGSLFAAGGGVTSEPARAIAALLRAGVDLMVMSGRNHDQTREAARMVGAAGFMAELGGIIVRGEDEPTRNFGSFRGGGRPFDAIVRSGAAGALLERYRGRLEPHSPWAFLQRECTVLLRGRVPVDEARSLLDDTGYGWLDVLDNGTLHGPAGRFGHLDVDEVHVYHLLPKGLSKASAIALDRHRMSLGREECIAVGDAASDAATANEVAAVFIVENGEGSVGGQDLADNVFVVDRPYGAGFADVVTALVGPGP